jgi:hypothetical protein
VRTSANTHRTRSAVSAVGENPPANQHFQPLGSQDRAQRVQVRRQHLAQRFLIIGRVGTRYSSATASPARSCSASAGPDSNGWHPPAPATNLQGQQALAFCGRTFCQAVIQQQIIALPGQIYRRLPPRGATPHPAVAGHRPDAGAGQVVRPKPQQLPGITRSDAGPRPAPER